MRTSFQFVAALALLALAGCGANQVVQKVDKEKMGTNEAIAALEKERDDLAGDGLDIMMGSSDPMDAIALFDIDAQIEEIDAKLDELYRGRQRVGEVARTTRRVNPTRTHASGHSCPTP